MNNIEVYLEGKLLYGDDFCESEIAEWYDDEREGYAELGAKNRASYKYVYHALNTYHGFRHLPEDSWLDVLGFGSAYGDELVPIINRVRNITIVDPSDSFVSESINGIPVRYIKPSPHGRLAVGDQAFDLITCFGVLHHIPNVSFVVNELARTLKPEGYMLIREPIVSMGDWRSPRRGLTKRERGIPLHILKNIVLSSGLSIVHQSLFAFPLTHRMFRPLRADVYNSSIATRIDAYLSQSFAWNINYHPGNVFQRFRPTAMFLVLRKPSA